MDREWRGSDYQLAAGAFTAGKVGLPRFSDKQGRTLLERLTATGNFAFYRDKTLPLAMRMEDFLKLQEAANSISKLYLGSAIKGEDVHKEMGRMMAFSLYTAALGIELVDEFIPTIPRDDKYDTRMDGVKRMRSGLTTMFVGAETSLFDRKFYSSDDLSTLLEAMASTLPHFKGAFSTEYRIELQKKLESHESDFKNADDVRRIKMMLTELKS